MNRLSNLPPGCTDQDIERQAGAFDDERDWNDFDDGEEGDGPASPATDPRLVWVICSSCRGNGTRVNPSIDGNGISREEFDEDPDFAESYMRGDYDVQCSVCRGLGRVKEIPFEELTPEEIKAAEDDARADASEAWLRRAESGERW